jgi:hypothetical protein
MTVSSASTLGIESHIECFNVIRQIRTTCRFLVIFAGIGSLTKLDLFVEVLRAAALDQVYDACISPKPEQTYNYVRLPLCNLS